MYIDEGTNKPFKNQNQKINIIYKYHSATSIKVINCAKKTFFKLKCSIAIVLPMSLSFPKTVFNQVFFKFFNL
jgi:hypothetical protein